MMANVSAIIKRSVNFLLLNPFIFYAYKKNELKQTNDNKWMTLNRSQYTPYLKLSNLNLRHVLKWLICNFSLSHELNYIYTNILHTYMKKIEEEYDIAKQKRNIDLAENRFESVNQHINRCKMCCICLNDRPNYVNMRALWTQRVGTNEWRTGLNDLATIQTICLFFFSK